MSFLRNLLPAAVATAVGVYTGLYIFGPTFKEEAEQKEQDHRRIDFESQRPPSSVTTSAIAEPTPSSTTSGTNGSSASAQNLVRKTEERVANAGGATTIPSSTPRWAEVQAGQYALARQTFNWSDVPLDGYSPGGNDQDQYGRKHD
ncbi:MAG: hypothetical protein Q9217_000112 [Psora testacea]